MQVQQRSLDDNRKASYSVNLAKSLQSRRTGVKLANYHFYSEPNKFSEYSRSSSLESQASTESKTKHQVPQRPAALQLQQNHVFDRSYATPSPLPEPGSPPSVTPIISPPPAFQDKSAKTRSFFGKAPFLPRSKAIEDSDNSPPSSPKEESSHWVTTAPNAPIIPKSKPTMTKASPSSEKPPRLGKKVSQDNEKTPPRSPKQEGQWVTAAPNAPLLPRPKSIVIKTSPGIEKPPRANKKVPQAKSLEETTASRRLQFKHQYGSSSSSSSSMGFRSLDSCLNRTSGTMPQLLENADSSVDICGDADEEDNNSSSINMNVTPINPNLLQAEVNRKLSPSGRTNRLTHYR